MGRPSNRAQRRGEIVDGLQAVMALTGYEAASTAEVARAAGLTAGLVHYHFQSKQEILLALVERLSRRLEERLEVRLAKVEGARGKLEAALDVHLALAQGEASAVACWVAIGAEAIRQPEVRDAYQSVLKRRAELLTSLLREALSEAELSGRRARAGAAGLSAAIEGYFQIAAAAPELVPRGSAATTAKRMLAGVLSA